MAEKILNTRIVNKNADLSSWNSSELPLKKGEIALAKFEAATTNPLDGSITTTPAYAIKVGVDGVKAFKDCAWLYAPASDVHAWAKAATKPSYVSTEINRGDGKNIEESIVALETAVGTGGSIAKAIEAAINALDYSDEAAANQFVTAVAQEDGKISVTRRALVEADIPTLGIDKISGLQTALDAKAVESSVAERFNAVNAKIGSTDDAVGAATVYGAIASAKKAGTDAQAYAEGVNTEFGTYKTTNDARVKAIEDDYTTADEAATIAQGKVDTFNTSTIVPLAEKVTANETAIATEKSRAEGVEGGLNTRLTTVEGKVDALSSATHFIGVKDTLEDVTDPVAGDIVIVANKEYIYDTGKGWVELGDTTAELDAIDKLGERLTTVETDIGETGRVTVAIKAAQDQADKGVADAKTANDAIAVINNETTGILAQAKADATAKANAAEAAAKSYTDAEAKKAMDAAVAAQSDIDTHEALVNNPHQVTKAQVGLGDVDNKSVATIKSEFTGSIAEGNDNFVKGGDAYTAIAAAKSGAEQTAASALATYKDANDKAVSANATDISTIKANYVRVEGTSLVYGQGEDAMTIVFDCGGVQ